MRIGRLSKALLVTTATGLWLVQGHASVGRTVVFVAGTALVTWAWIALGSARTDSRAAGLRPAAAPHKRCADRRIERKPRGRIARDVRCPATRATARARRSTRR